MKTTHTQNLMAAALIGALAVTTAQAQTVPKMKMKTDIRPEITTPDTRETRPIFQGRPALAVVSILRFMHASSAALLK